MKGSKIKIRTPLGETELDPEEKVEVFIDRNNSTYKRAVQLAPGDRVLFRKSSAHLDNPEKLQDTANELLEANPVYRHARSRIYHVFNSQRQVTMLRKLILESMIERGVLPDTPEVSRAIVMESGDLTREQFAAVRASLDEILQERGKSPSDTTFQSWIKNKTVLPYSEYRGALTAVNSELGEFTDSTEGSRYRAWVFWAACRQQVMRRIHQKGAEDNNGNGTRKKDTKKGVGIIVNDIANQIIEDYDPDSALVTILDRTSVVGGLEESALVSRQTPSTLSVEQIMKDNSVIYSYVIPILAEYLTKRGFDSRKFASIETALMKRFMASMGGSENLLMKAPDKLEISESELDNIMDDVVFNIPDKVIGLRETTTRSLIELSSRLALLIPKEITEATLALGRYLKAGTIERGILEKKLKHLGRKIEERYGTNPHGIYHEKTVWQFMDSNGQYLFDETDPEKVRERIIELAKKEHVRLYNRAEIAETLQRYGLEWMIDANPWNFILEEGTTNYLAPIINRKEEIKRYSPNEEWLRNSTAGHNQLVRFLLHHPDKIEPGLKVVGSEYSFAGDEGNGGWARADIVYEDSQGGLLVVEVKQNATYNNGFHNEMKAVEQTAGYRAALEARLALCPLTRDLGVGVRGMLVAYQIDDNAKLALEKLGLGYAEFTMFEDRAVSAQGKIFRTV